MSNQGSPLVVVAGGGGFLGSEIAARAQSLGFTVHATWRSKPPPAGVEGHRLDLDDPVATARLLSDLEPDIVVLSVSGPHRPVTPKERLAAWRDAPSATTSVLEAVRHRPPHVIALASSHELKRSDEPLSTEGLSPVSLRGIAASAAVATARLWSRETGAPLTVLRPMSVYGPGEPPDRVIPTLLRAAAANLPFPLTDAESGRDFVHVSDIADGVIRAARDRVVGEFNLGTGVNTSIVDLVGLVEKVTGVSIDVRRGAFAARTWDRAVWVAETDHAASVLGWRANVGLVDGLRGLAL